jgi:ABC-type nitrate/sulfonate/bicarbonate transport system substrate-binding protein
VRIPAVLLACVIVAGCGGTASTSRFGEVPLSLASSPGADEAGVYFATARGYDEAEGVELRLTQDRADFRLVAQPPEGCIAVLAVVRPQKLVLCADEVTLQDERPKVLAVARALRRGYLQAQMEPDEAVAAMVEQVPSLDRDRLSTDLDAAAPTWTAGAPYFGELAPGPGRDPSIARELNDE